jgi:hypothetical protein
MSEKYFDIERDKKFPCFCLDCATGKSAEEQSPDSRYCHNCYKFLLKEAEILPMNKRPGWLPKYAKLVGDS